MPNSMCFVKENQRLFLNSTLRHKMESVVPTISASRRYFVSAQRGMYGFLLMEHPCCKMASRYSIEFRCGNYFTCCDPSSEDETKQSIKNERRHVRKTYPRGLTKAWSPGAWRWRKLKAAVQNIQSEIRQWRSGQKPKMKKSQHSPFLAFIFSEWFSVSTGGAPHPSKKTKNHLRFPWVD